MSETKAIVIGRARFDIARTFVLDLSFLMNQEGESPKAFVDVILFMKSCKFVKKFLKYYMLRYII